MHLLFYLPPIIGLAALYYTLNRFIWVSKQNAGNDKMKMIASFISRGAMAFLKAEYKVLIYFVIIAALLLAIMGASNANSHWSIAIAFVLGAFLSALAGFIGMSIATRSNVRTAEAARTSLRKALHVSFTGGAVMGVGVAGLAVLGLGALFIVLIQHFAPHVLATDHAVVKVIEILTGFSLGAIIHDGVYHFKRDSRLYQFLFGARI